MVVLLRREIAGLYGLGEAWDCNPASAKEYARRRSKPGASTMSESRPADRVEIPLQPVSGPPMGRRTALAVIGGAVAGLSGFILGSSMPSRSAAAPTPVGPNSSDQPSPAAGGDGSHGALLDLAPLGPYLFDQPLVAFVRGVANADGSLRWDDMRTIMEPETSLPVEAAGFLSVSVPSRLGVIRDIHVATVSGGPAPRIQPLRAQGLLPQAETSTSPKVSPPDLWLMIPANHYWKVGAYALEVRADETLRFTFALT